jgi:hypothetical protein
MCFFRYRSLSSSFFHLLSCFFSAGPEQFSHLLGVSVHTYATVRATTMWHGIRQGSVPGLGQRGHQNTPPPQKKKKKKTSVFVSKTASKALKKKRDKTHYKASKTPIFRLFFSFFTGPGSGSNRKRPGARPLPPTVSGSGCAQVHQASPDMWRKETHALMAFPRSNNRNAKHKLRTINLKNCQINLGFTRLDRLGYQTCVFFLKFFFFRDGSPHMDFFLNFSPFKNQQVTKSRMSTYIRWDNLDHGPEKM